MKYLANGTFVVAALVCLIPATAFTQTAYFQDFESLSQVDGALAADGWLGYVNVFDPNGVYLYGYGPFPAPNNLDPGNYCDIVMGQGGYQQDLKQLVMYSNYYDEQHGNGFWLESNLFQEQVLPAGTTGTWYFTFDAKLGNLGGNSLAAAFIKTLDPDAGYAITRFIVEEMTGTPATWTDYSLSLDVSGLDNQFLQFGFLSVATNYEPCGIFYDNVAFSDDGTVAIEVKSFSSVKSLFR